MSNAPHYHKRLVEIVADTAATQNTDILEADFQKTYDDTILRISSSADAINLRLVPSSGSGVNLLNGGTSSGKIVTEEHNVDRGRTWNVQTSTTGGGTLRLLIIDEVRL